MKQRKKLRIIFANKREFDNYIYERTRDSPCPWCFCWHSNHAGLAEPGLNWWELMVSMRRYSTAIFTLSLPILATTTVPAWQRTKRCHLLILRCREPFRQEHRSWLSRCCWDRRCWQNHWQIGWRWRCLVIDKVLGIRCTSFGYQSARLWVLCQGSTSVAATVCS